MLSPGVPSLSHPPLPLFPPSLPTTLPQLPAPFGLPMSGLD